MEGGGRGARIALYAVCSAFAALAVTISLYYLRDCKRNRKKGSKKGILHSSLRVPDEEATTSFTEELELAEVFKDNGHGEFTRKTISSLLRMLDRVQDHMLDKLLVALLNCSAFTRNQVNNIAQLRTTSSEPGLPVLGRVIPFLRPTSLISSCFVIIKKAIIEKIYKRAV